MKTRRNYRGKMQIIRDILYAIKISPVTTHIIYQANTTSKNVNTIISVLEKRGLVTCEALPRNRYHTYLTDDGQELTGLFRRVDRLLEFDSYVREQEPLPWK